MPNKARDPSSTYQRRFGARLRMRRIDCGYDTVAAFAQAIGEHPETYRTYETGIRWPKPHTLAKIAEKLDVSLDYLIMGRTPG